MNSTPDSDEIIFSQALALPLADRAAYLDAACAGDAALRARIDSLLRVPDEAPEFMDTGAAEIPRPPAEASAGEMIGRYKLLQKIGEGGIGVVFMAEQEEPIRRRVAVKVIKLGMDTKEVIARFEAERQALALMDHPNIARVFDAGATESGRPFFVMELVRGIPITKFCDEQNLPTRARLDLFTHVCHAVQHAHQKGIIHRDLKPSNILVTLHDGVPVPKVIDFGIAKATAGRLTDNTLFTAFEQFIGTPAYMSPEQAEMSGLDIDTRSDIYSLGVLLYELLTGRPPFDPKSLLSAGLDEIRRIIREVDPPKPSTRLSTMLGEALSTAAKQRQIAAPKLIILIRGDLDWIVMKALEKNRARRYETANGLADDIQRHLANEPVTACPPTTAYRLSKMIRRNKLAFAAGGAIAATLIVGLSLSTWMFFREKAARERAVAAEQEQTQLRQQADRERGRAVAAERTATEEAAISRAVSDFLTDDLLRQADSRQQASDKATPNPDLKVREALNRASDKVGPRFKDQPLTEAAVRAAIGSALQGVGDYATAVLHHERSTELRKAALGVEHPTTLDSMRNLAGAYQSQGKSAEAAALGTQTLEIQKRVLGPEHPSTLASMNNLANMYGALGKQVESAALRQQTFEIQKRVLGQTHPSTLLSMTNLAASYLSGNQPDAAAAISAEAWEIQKRILGHHHPNTLLSMQNLATAYFQQGRHGEATALSTETVAMLSRVLGAEHPDTLRSKMRFQALNVQIQERTLGPEHPTTLGSMITLARFYLEHGLAAAATLLCVEAWEVQKRVLGPEHPNTLAVMNTLARAYHSEGKQVEAAALYSQLWSVQKRVLGPEHSDTLESMTGLAQAYRLQGRAAEAVTLRVQLLEVHERTLGPMHVTTLTGLQILGAAHEAAGQLAEAETRLRTLISRLPTGTDSARSMLGLVLVKQRKYAEAETVLRPLHAIREESQPDLWTTFVTRFSLGAALAGQGKHTESELLLVSGAEGLLKRIDTIRPVDKERVRESLEQLVQFYTARARPDDAAVWRQKLDEFNVAHKPAPAARP